jgi:hypothetical protein
MKWPYSVHAGLLLALLTLPSFIHELRPWPLFLLAPLTIYALIVTVIPPLRRGVHWLRVGRIDGAVLAWMAAIILGSSAALVLWFVLARPDVGDLAEKIPHVGPMQLLLIGITFSLANALMEEAIFRGVFQEALTADWGPWPAVVIQGVLFGVVHIQGFPRGVEGMVMASAYGVALGWLRLRSKGMAAVCIAHVCADVTIFTLLVLQPGF